MADQKPDDVIAREEARRAHDRVTSFTAQVNEAAIKTGESTFQACLVINGGAAVSALAFIGGLASKDVIGVSQLAAVADSLTAFAVGVVAAVVGMSLSYFVNYLTAMHAISLTHTWEHPWIVPGKRTVWFSRLITGLFVLTILAGVASIVFFLCGVVAVRNSFEHIQPTTHIQAPSAKPSP